VMYFMSLGVLFLLFMKILEDRRYVVINPYIFTVLEILGDLFVSSCIVCPHYSYIWSIKYVVYFVPFLKW